jgi:hemerythrin-like domain-containing protein
MNTTLEIVQRRNTAMARVLAALLVHGRRGKAGIAPDFGWLTGLLSYVNNTARGRHFSDEEVLVLRPLERLAPELRPKIARARRDHVGSSGYCYRMAEALAHWQKGWDKAIDMYLENAHDHFRLAKAHARLMRAIIVPAADRILPASHWQAAASDIQRSPDPLSGCTTRSDYEAAFCSLLGWAAPPLAQHVVARSALESAVGASGD